MTSVHGRAYVERAPEQGPIPWVVANEGLMADGIDLKMSNLDLGRFEQNPIIGYGHDYWGRESLPIGRAVETAVAGPKLRMLVEFDAGDDFARTVDRKVRGGFLNTMSVGFSVSGIDDQGVPAAWELFESSVVPLPMDPNATAERLARSLSALREGQVVSTEDAAALLRAAGLQPPATGHTVNIDIPSGFDRQQLMDLIRANTKPQTSAGELDRADRERRLRLAMARR